MLCVQRKATAAEFVADCRRDGARDFGACDGDSLPTVQELIDDQAGVWADDEVGAEYGADVQAQGLRAWAEGWHAAAVRAQLADVMRAGDEY